ncbi:uncharacterized protein LOC133144511 isoform X1 [Syngnathus typhle]|uniref:uncharacterized protein LOC133144511 isoform X1 n=1 Tax=Syngnathus typhle TaxID=161592 RepID=UPI002A6AAE84|nr:uncharacterized protein LOC133144511 isoform X1 [Syngnathus typhle]
MLRLLLLVELLGQSRCGPAHHNAILCNVLKSAVNQMDVIRKTARRLQPVRALRPPAAGSAVPVASFAFAFQYDEEEAAEADDFLDTRLQSLPVIATTAAHLRTWKANESLSRLYANALAFRAHAEWLKAAAENVSLPSEAAGVAAVHLLRLANLVRTALIQMEVALPPPPPRPSLPAVLTAFEALRYSAEMSRRLGVFCGFSKRLVRHLRRVAACPSRR